MNTNKIIMPKWRIKTYYVAMLGWISIMRVAELAICMLLDGSAFSLKESIRIV